jgi:signal transduction histidine kinase
MTDAQMESLPGIDWYRDVVAGAPDLIDIVDQEGRILYSNAFLKLPDTQIQLGTPIYEYFFEEFHGLVREKIAKVFATGCEDYYELATDYNSPTVEWYMTRLGPIIRDGKVVAVSLFIRNITRIKDEEDKLARLNEALEDRVRQRTAELQAYANRLEASEVLNTDLRKAERRQDVMTILAGHSLGSLDADLAGIYLFDGQTLRLVCCLNHTVAPPDILREDTDAYFYHLLQTRKTEFVDLSQADGSDCGICGFIANQQIKALLVAPLRNGETVTGVLYLGYRQGRLPASEDEKLLNTFVESGSNTLHRIQVMEQLEQNIHQREHELKVLYEVMRIASEARESDQLLHESLRTALKVLNGDRGAIHLYDFKAGKLYMAVSDNISTPFKDWLEISGLYKDLWNKVYQTRKILRVDKVQSQSYPEMTDPNVTVLSYIGVPILAKGSMLGVLSSFNPAGLPVGLEVDVMIQTIADQIGLSLESLFQRKQADEALILEERQRLARDLHDSVSQSLYGLVLSADIGNKFLKMKAYPELTQTLGEIGETALQSLKEMRLMLFELRPISFETVGLTGALELRLNTVERRAGMETRLVIEGADFIPQTIDIEIYRIITEALNNSLKHSYAHQILVEIKADSEKITIRVDDDGKGFSTREPRVGGIGLSSMQERTHRMAGQLQIISGQGQGTSIRIDIPLVVAVDGGKGNG